VSAPYVMGIWLLKPGRADEFVAAWTEFAEWTRQHPHMTGWAKLLRDVDNADRFISFGPWESMDAIYSWRALDGWKDRVDRILDMLIGFEPVTLEAVVERG
jgi:heme-degrading monooxygenase HmoA